MGRYYTLDDDADFLVDTMGAEPVSAEEAMALLATATGVIVEIADQETSDV
jgi:hypothetical protein